MLLERHDVPPAKAVSLLGGLQAQEPRPPFVALWSRIDEPDALLDAIRAGDVVRATMMRGTLHLVSKADFRALRGALQPGLDQITQGVLKARKATDVDPAAVGKEARRLLKGGGMTFNELRPKLAKKFPGRDDRALGYLARLQVPLVMEPTDDRWGYARDSAFAVGPKPEPGSPAALIKHYLRAFGPATVADAERWSGVRGLAPAFERMKLRTFADERGRTLYDVPDGPLPDPAAPAPVRFLAEFDSLVLAHDDRRRLIAEEHRGKLTPGKNLRVLSAFLVDGYVAGTWSVKATKTKAALTLEPFGKATKAVRAELEAEGEGLLAFLAPGAAPSFTWR